MTRAATARLDGEDWGLLVDRTRPVAFTFDGRPHQGLHGDVIASALAAEGRRVLSRSPRYHRPRGILTMAGQDPGTLVEVGHDPRVPAGRFPLSDGLAVRSINNAGSLDADALAALDLLARFLPVGFLYKTFFRPKRAWPLFERLIRSLAGTGRLDPAAPRTYYEHAHLEADVLIVGAGPAGLSAAIAAARAGAGTLVIDEWPEPGGSLLYGRGGIDRAATDARRAALVSEARAFENLHILSATTVTSLYPGNRAAAVAADRLYRIRAREIVLATGAADQLLVFRHNDRPGIMFASAAQRLLRFYAVAPGRRAVVATANRLGYEAALDLLDAGIDVAAVLDLNMEARGAAVEAVRARGVPVLLGTTVIEAAGRKGLRRVAVGSADPGRRAEGDRHWIACDLLLMSVGFAPALDLAAHAGARIVYDPAINMHRAAALPPGLALAGAAGGVWSDEAVLLDGEAAGRRAALRARGYSVPAPAGRGTDPGALDITHAHAVFASRDGKDFVDLGGDVVAKDIVNAASDGYEDIELATRYAALGSGPGRGRYAQLATLRLLATCSGRTVGRIGTAALHPPLASEKLALLAGDAAPEPVCPTPLHARHVELGAHMAVTNTWLRPAWYGDGGEDGHPVDAEVMAVRTGVGLIDVSALGGLDIHGPDAAAFLDRACTGAQGRQPAGRARYALMLDDEGFIAADGMAWRLDEHHVYLTVPVGAAAGICRRMRALSARWRMDVEVTDVTMALAGVNVAGPRARALVQSLTAGLDFSNAAFPYLGARAGVLGGFPVRVLRAGFVGEVSYEIHVPAELGEALWDRLMDVGRRLDVRPVGAEAEDILRLEKGRVVVGRDTDERTCPVEAGLAWALSASKADYVGKRAVERRRSEGRAHALSGFVLLDPEAPMPEDGHLVIRDGGIAGHVTSVARSPTLGRVIGLAVLPPDLAAPGASFTIRAAGGALVAAEAVPTPFYDPASLRQEAGA